MVRHRASLAGPVMPARSSAAQPFDRSSLIRSCALRTVMHFMCGFMRSDAVWCRLVWVGAVTAPLAPASHRATR